MPRRRRRSDTGREERGGFASSAGKSRLSKGEGSARSIGSGRGSTSGSRRRRSGGGIRSSSIARSAALCSERMGMSSTVVPARSIGMEHGITGDVWLGERREDFARNAGRFQQGRIGSCCEECSAKNIGAIKRNLQRTEEGRTMHAMRKGPEGKDSEMRGMSEGQEAEGDLRREMRKE